MPGIVKISAGQCYGRPLGYVFPNGQEVRIGCDINGFRVVITSAKGSFPIFPMVNDSGETLYHENRIQAERDAKETFDWFMANPQLLPGKEEERHFELIDRNNGVSCYLCPECAKSFNSHEMGGNFVVCPDCGYSVGGAS